MPGGVIETEGGNGTNPITAYAHNLERRVLDPVLRQCSLETAQRAGTIATKTRQLRDAIVRARSMGRLNIEKLAARACEIADMEEQLASLLAPATANSFNFHQEVPAQ